MGRKMASEPTFFGSLNHAFSSRLRGSSLGSEALQHVGALEGAEEHKPLFGCSKTAKHLRDLFVVPPSTA